MKQYTFLKHLLTLNGLLILNNVQLIVRFCCTYKLHIFYKNLTPIGPLIFNSLLRVPSFQNTTIIKSQLQKVLEANIPITNHKKSRVNIVVNFCQYKTIGVINFSVERMRNVIHIECKLKTIAIMKNRHFLSQTIIYQP